MKSKVLSVIVIGVFYGYIAFGLISQTPGFKAPTEALTGYKMAATLASFFFALLGVCFAGYFTVKWILK